MKVAIVHDYLNQFGGAERVLEALLKIFPQAHVYTLLYSKEKTRGLFGGNVYKTSFLDFDLVKRNHRPFIPLMPLAIESMKVYGDYDLVISATAGYSKGISIEHKSEKKDNPYHIAYCYTPLRYAWEIDNYFRNPIFKTFFRPAFDYLRKWDFQAAQKPQKILAVSKFIAGKIKNFYGREAKVVYPPVDYEKFYPDDSARSAGAVARQIRTPTSPRSVGERRSYYLAVGRLLHYKKFDLIVETFKKNNLSLKIVGSGPEGRSLKNQIANHKNIEFISGVSDEELHRLYHGAKAFLFPQVEDFGLVAAEAQACGTPVIAFRGGGALEIVEDGVTGIFFDKQTSPDLIRAVERFEMMDWDRREISERSRKFSFEKFREGILSQIPQNILKL